MLALLWNCFYKKKRILFGSKLINFPSGGNFQIYCASYLPCRGHFGPKIRAQYSFPNLFPSKRSRMQSLPVLTSLILNLCFPGDFFYSEGSFLTPPSPVRNQNPPSPVRIPICYIVWDGDGYVDTLQLVRSITSTIDVLLTVP